MNIATKELRNLCNLLITYLERKGYNTISFAQEDAYYQKVWHSDRNLEQTPPITLGLISDDITALKQMLHDGTPTAYDFEQFGALLTAIGATLANNTLHNNKSS